MRPHLCLVAAAVAAVLSLPSASPAAPRFFFAGSGRLQLHHGHFGTTLDVRYRRNDGTYDPEALTRIQHFFRSREDGREAPISLRLIELLAYVQDHYRPQQMTLLSGYRSPAFNTELGGAAQTSLHTQGLAADVAFSGIDLRRLWRQLRALHAGGTGYYRTGKFLHIDSGPPRFWEETTSRVSENLSADNARVFVRTDFDRYASIQGAICSLHSVTAFPLLIASHAKILGPHGTSVLALTPVNPAVVEQRDGCFAITNRQDAYEFRVTGAERFAASGAPSGPRARVIVATCTPRIGKTPMEVESNPIEVTPAPGL